MINTVKGIVISKGNNNVCLELGSISFTIHCVTKDIVMMKINKQQMLFTHLQIKDENPVLYGFIKQDSREMFHMLLGVSGVGPKIALRIIDGISVEHFVERILEEDADGLAKSVKGLGAGISQKIILSLRKSFKEKKFNWLEGVGSPNGVDLERIASALSNMGYKDTEIQRVLKKMSITDPNDNEEMLLKKALLQLSSSIK